LATPTAQDAHGHRTMRAHQHLLLKRRRYPHMDTLSGHPNGDPALTRAGPAAQGHGNTQGTGRAHRRQHTPRAHHRPESPARTSQLPFGSHPQTFNR
jgi:hypothetical protein